MNKLKCAAFLFLALSAGCGPKYGKIVGKDFVPAHTESVIVPHFTTDGDGHTDVTFETEDVDVPDRWYITIQGTNNSGKIDCATLQVPAEDFYTFQEGQLYPPAER